MHHMSNILQWEPSHSWTGKADVEDIERLRRDLAALEKLVALKADEVGLRLKADLQRLTPAEQALAALQADFAGLKRHVAETTHQIQEQLDQLDQWVKSGAVAACLQALCNKQAQTIDELCGQHREKFLEITRTAEGAESEIKSFSKACRETLQATTQVAADAQSSAEQYLQTMARLAAESAAHSAAAQTASQESQGRCAEERDLRNKFEQMIQTTLGEVNQTRTGLLEVATAIFDLKESVIATAEQSRLYALDAGKNLDQTGQLLDRGAEQLALCKDALDRAQAAQGTQEDLACRITDQLNKAKNYRLELKSVALKTEIDLGKVRQRNGTFRGRLRWLLRGSPESFGPV